MISRDARIAEREMRRAATVAVNELLQYERQRANPLAIPPCVREHIAAYVGARKRWIATPR